MLLIVLGSSIFRAGPRRWRLGALALRLRGLVAGRTDPHRAHAVPSTLLADCNPSWPKTGHQVCDRNEGRKRATEYGG